MEALKLQPSLAHAHAARGWGFCQSGWFMFVYASDLSDAILRGSHQFFSGG